MSNIDNMRRQLRHDGRDVRLERRGRHLRPGLLPLEPVVLPAVPEGGPGLPREVGRRLVPERRDAGARAGRGRRPPLLALRREGREARPGPVVPARHQVRRRAARLQRDPVPGAGPDQQTNWIGRSEGGEIVFETAPADHHAGGEELRVFTTRPDTLFGATFMVLAPEHPLVAGADGAGAPGGGRGVRRARRDRDRDRAPVDRAREDRRRHRRRRDQPGQRRADPDLRRRLRAGRLRHRRDHGRPGPRRARLRVRADSSGCRSAGSSRAPGEADADLGEAYVAHADDEVLVNSGEFSGLPADEGGRRDRRLAGGRRARAGRRSPTGCATG